MILGAGDGGQVRLQTLIKFREIREKGRCGQRERLVFLVSRPIKS